MKKQQKLQTTKKKLNNQPFKSNTINRKVSVAPMMDCTDRHDRFFFKIDE